MQQYVIIKYENSCQNELVFVVQQVNIVTKVILHHNRQI